MPLIEIRDAVAWGAAARLLATDLRNGARFVVSLGVRTAMTQWEHEQQSSASARHPQTTPPADNRKAAAG
jgi:hypothetical protein